MTFRPEVADDSSATVVELHGGASHVLVEEVGELRKKSAADDARIAALYDDRALDRAQIVKLRAEIARQAEERAAPKKRWLQWVLLVIAVVAVAMVWRVFQVDSREASLFRPIQPVAEVTDEVIEATAIPGVVEEAPSELVDPTTLAQAARTAQLEKQIADGDLIPADDVLTQILAVEEEQKLHFNDRLEEELRIRDGVHEAEMAAVNKTLSSETTRADNSEARLDAATTRLTELGVQFETEKALAVQRFVNSYEPRTRVTSYTAEVEYVIDRGWFGADESYPLSIPGTVELKSSRSTTKATLTGDQVRVELGLPYIDQEVRPNLDYSQRIYDPDVQGFALLGQIFGKVTDPLVTIEMAEQHLMLQACSDLEAIKAFKADSEANTRAALDGFEVEIVWTTSSGTPVPQPTDNDLLQQAC